MTMHKTKSHPSGATCEIIHFKCDICNKVFVTEIALIKHQLASHVASNTSDTFECEICHTRFSDEINLIKHQLATHVDTSDTASDATSVTIKEEVETCDITSEVSLPFSHDTSDIHDVKNQVDGDVQSVPLNHFTSDVCDVKIKVETDGC